MNASAIAEALKQEQSMI
ncbi:hypothetical protein MUP00_05880, partial [Candidatus Bathyarchaeota archaeon]|nr:hypothetical protein [Candidatus Bathyarchaeota archaeon]